MGHSIQEFRGRYAIINDIDTVCVVSMIAQMCSDGTGGTWLAERVPKWKRALEVAGVGCIDLDLDEALPTDDDVSRFSEVLDAVRAKAISYGDTVPEEAVFLLEAWMSARPKRHPAHLIVGAVDKLEKLLTPEPPVAA